MSEKIGLTKEEILAAFSTPELQKQFPPVMDVKDVARMLGRSVKTIYDWHESGRFKGASRRRGKRIFFWRDHVIDRIFNGPDWADQPNNKKEITNDPQ